MADAKTTQLTENIDPQLPDLLAMVDDPAGTPISKKITIETLAALFSKNTVARQAVINGNFDIWQRGTSVNLTDATNIFLADRWQEYTGRDGGTLPTLTRLRVAEADDNGSYYFTRLTSNGAGSSLGVNSLGVLYQTIENGVRYLCGSGKKITVSFWARSDIAGKRITPTIAQNYGAGGSPTTTEEILGTPITLTSTWTKYTVTFTTNTLIGKTFGTTGPDYVVLNFWYMWGTTTGNNRVQASVTAETYGGAGNVDIKKVQLCAGDVALPFMPKSYRQELTDCQRYCVLLNESVYAMFAVGFALTSVLAWVRAILPVEMRTIPILQTTTAAKHSLHVGASIACTALALAGTSSDACTRKSVVFAATVASGLVEGHGVEIYTNESGYPIILSAEL